MNDPVNDDLFPEHAEVDSFLTASRREHAERLTEALDLDTGLDAILASGGSGDGYEALAIAAEPVRPASSPAEAPLPGSRAAYILAARSLGRDLARHLAVAVELEGALVGGLERALDLGLDLASSEHLDLVRALEHIRGRGLFRGLGRVGRSRATERARALQRDLASALVRARALDRAGELGIAVERGPVLADGLAIAVKRARILVDDLASADGRARSRSAAGYARQLRSALDLSCTLVYWAERVEVDASGADLSTLDLKDMSVLDGVVWSDKTTWPPGVRGQLEPPRSREIVPGVYQVQSGNERDPSALLTR